MKIRLHIEHLLLDGVPLTSDQATILEASLASQLVERFAASSTPPWLSGNAQIRQLEAGSIHWDARSRPEFMGGQLAGAIHGGLMHGKER